MKLLLSLLFTLSATLLLADDRADRTVILDEAGVKNLGLKTAMVEESDFEETVFALGRIDVYPGRRAAISSRIPGRALEVFVKHDHSIAKGDVALIVESRQPGNPSPRIEITAPLTGLVSVVHVVPGEPVEPDKVLAEILDLSEVYALARVPEHWAEQLKRGLKARITVPAAGNQVFEAELEHLGATADADSGTVEAAFHIDNPKLDLRPGMRAEFSIVLKKRSGVMSVPRSALQGDPANQVVYVKDFELPNAFIRTPVQTGTRNEEFVEIESGLFPGDEVVTSGSYLLGFSGGGGISLKEALDAAHGHEHNEDGSEMTAAQRAASARPAGSEPASGASPFTYFFAATSAILLVLLLLTRRKSH